MTGSLCPAPRWAGGWGRRRHTRYQDGSPADADGYTLFIGSIPTLAIGAALYANAGYDPVTSFAPAASLSGGPFFLVIHPSVPAQTLVEFIERIAEEARRWPPIVRAAGLKPE